MQALLFGFRGRFNRTRFWLVHIGVGLVATAVASAAFITVVVSTGVEGARAAMATTGIVASLLFIPLIWISFAASVKRWHDCDKSGWWMLVNFIPVIGGLWFLIECGFLPGTPGPNAYGPDPLVAG